MNSFQQGPQDKSRLFGFSYRQDDLEEVKKLSPVPPNMDDGVTVAAGGLTGYGVDLDGGHAKGSGSDPKVSLYGDAPRS